MKISRLIFIPLLLIFLSLSLVAQEDVLRPNGKPGVDYSKFEKSSFILGVRTGLNYNMFSQELSWTYPTPYSPYAAYESGAGLSLYLGVIADMPINDDWGVQFGLDIDNIYITNDKIGKWGCITEDFVTFQNDVEYEYEVTGTMFDIRALFRYNITDEFVMLLGPVLRLSMDNFEEEMSIEMLGNSCEFVDPLTFVSYKKSTNTEDVSVKSQFGVEFGLGYKIELSKKMWLVPECSFQYYFSKIQPYRIDLNYDASQYTLTGLISPLSFSEAMLHSLKFGIAIWFEI